MHSGKPLALAVAAVLGSTVFGRYAQDLSRWGMCTYGSEFCNATQIVDALNIGIAVSSLAAIGISAASVNAGLLHQRESDLAMIGAFIGALLALLDAAEPYIQQDGVSLGKPIFFWGVAVLLFLLPRLIAPSSSRNAGHDLAATIVIGVLIAGTLGAIIQESVDTIWDRSTASPGGVHPAYYFLKPAGYAAAVSGWALALLDPFLRRSVWGGETLRSTIWVSSFFLSALILAAGYGATFAARQSLSGGSTSLFAVALIAPPLAVLIVTAWTMSSGPRIRWIFVAAAAAAVTQTAASFFVAVVRGPVDDNYSVVDGQFFVVLHAITGAVIVFSVFLSAYLGAKIAGRSRSNRPQTSNVS